jgi:hypothetical protein
MDLLSLQGVGSRNMVRWRSEVREGLTGWRRKSMIAFGNDVVKKLKTVQ